MPDLKKLITLEALQAALPSWLKSLTKPSYNADEISDNSTVNKFVTETDKANWNAKGTYSKPSDGIPKSDLSSLVQASLDNADSALQFETDPTVPTWAKQPNKPSYTQDEVPDGSTYKRVSSTEKSAWNGKQNALSTTQMQAVNSGITSEKVTQIETNKTNILYAIEHGQKNQLNFDGWATLGTGVTWKLNDDKTITATGTATNLNYIVLQLNGSDVVADSLCDGLHFLSGCPSGGDFDSKYSMYVSKGSYTPTDTGSGVVLPATSETGILVVIRISSGFAIPSGGLLFKPMICLKAVYDVYPEYQQFGAPNSDLTYLEAEDRAALAEVVDSGAKNIADFKSTTNCTVNSNGYTISVSGQPSSSATQWIWEGKVAKSGYYTFAVKGTSIPTTVLYNATDDTNVLLYNTGSGGESSGYLAAGKTYKIGAYLNSSTTYSASFDCMLCTKAAFGVSQKFVPYQVPITGAMSVVDKEIVCSSTLTTTGIKFTSTEKAAYRITATAIYYNSIPMKLAIKHKISPSMSQGTLCTAVHVENEDVSLTVSGIRLLDVGGEFEIFAQYASSTNNRFYVLVEKIG